MPHVGRRRSGHLDIGIVAPERLGGQVDAADERRLGRHAGVDHPALLVPAESGGRAIPADAHARAPRSQHLAVLRGPPESAPVGAALRIVPPEQGAHVDTARGRAIEQVEQRAAPVGKLQILVVEGDGEPNAVPRVVYRLADPAERSRAADQWPDEIAIAYRIAARRDSRKSRERSAPCRP